MPEMPRKWTQDALAKQWQELYDLIRAFADAQEAESWKGGGDPESYRELELEVELARERLMNHIRIMRRIRDEEDRDEKEKSARNKPKVSRRSSRSNHKEKRGKAGEDVAGSSDVSKRG